MSGVESWNVKSIEERGSERHSRIRPYSDVQLFFLLRLERLLRVRRAHGVVGFQRWWAKLLNKAIYSTYCDCIELGVAKTLAAC